MPYYYCYLILLLSTFYCDTYCGVVGVDATETTTTSRTNNNNNYENEIIEHLKLFHYSEELHVIGPTKFPKPTEIFRLETRIIELDDPDYTTKVQQQKLVHDGIIDNDNTIELVPYIQPVHGKHRPEKDALVAFAAEYTILNYLSFIESLRDTGYKGDIVLCISPLDVQKEDVWAYLTNADDEQEDGLRVILYAPTLTCYNAEREVVDSFKGGSRVCYGHNMYGIKNKKSGESITPLLDPRSPRTVQTLRYELYWIMCQSYNPYSWIFIIDARDSVFQLHPFEQLPHRTRPANITEPGGFIYMFGENVEATRLGKSASNRRWLQAAYGDVVGTQWLANKPTICSGATVGEWIALETYLRAMIAESDYTGVVLAGADQGFHNYIHYSHKLKHTTSTIRAIIVFDQGQGIVNNMGALRTKALEEWGNHNIVKKEDNKYIVQNWDGTPSPVVHQFDRHKELSNYFFKTKGNEYIRKWNERKVKIVPKNKQ